jgi:ABC-type transporter Mla subunit MlaD
LLSARFTPWWLVAVAVLWPVIELGVFTHAARPGLQFVMDCHVNRACLPSKILATTGSIAAASGQSYKASVQMEKMGEQGVLFLTGVNKSVPLVIGETQKTIASAGSLIEDTKTQLHDLLASSKTLVDGLKTDVDSLASKAGGDLDALRPDLEALKPVLVNLATLEKDLDDQIKVGGPKLLATIDAMSGTINDVDRILAGEDIKAIVGNTAKTTAEMLRSAESIKMALEPLRQKLSLLKIIINKAITLITQAAGVAIGKHW